MLISNEFLGSVQRAGFDIESYKRFEPRIPEEALPTCILGFEVFREGTAELTAPDFSTSDVKHKGALEQGLFHGDTLFGEHSV